MNEDREKELRKSIAKAEKIAITLSLITIFLSGVGYVMIITDIERYTAEYRGMNEEYEILIDDVTTSLDSLPSLRRNKRQNGWMGNRRAHTNHQNAHHRRTHVDFAVDLDPETEVEEAAERDRLEQESSDRSRASERHRQTTSSRREPPRICDCARIKCPRGPPGPPGEDGETAEDGEPGRPGKPGVDGIYQQDTVCDPCPPGRPGNPGPPGETGRQGRSGKPGHDGRDGVNEKGVPGEDGPRGLPGRQGKKGETGELGQDSVQLVGTPGPKGRPGPRGFAGPRGDPGKNGRAAMPGPEGPRGPPGEPGEMGEPGPQGSPGRPGEAGKDGGYCNCPSRNGDSPLGFNKDFDSTEYPEAGHYERENTVDSGPRRHNTKRPKMIATLRVTQEGEFAQVSRRLHGAQSAKVRQMPIQRPKGRGGKTIGSEIEFDLRK